MAAMLPFLVEVELVRHLERAGNVLVPGSLLRVPIDEAQALFRADFARPAGASADFGHVPPPAWMTAWRP